jgi:hypothetical protein
MWYNINKEKMTNFYADNRYYLDFSKIVFLEHAGMNNEKIVISLLNGKVYNFYEDEERDYKIYKALKAWHEEKIKEVK